MLAFLYNFQECWARSIRDNEKSESFHRFVKCRRKASRCVKPHEFCLYSQNFKSSNQINQPEHLYNVRQYRSSFFCYSSTKKISTLSAHQWIAILVQCRNKEVSIARKLESSTRISCLLWRIGDSGSGALVVQIFHSEKRCLASYQWFRSSQLSSTGVDGVDATD